MKQRTKDLKPWSKVMKQSTKDLKPWATEHEHNMAKRMK